MNNLFVTTNSLPTETIKTSLPTTEDVMFFVKATVSTSALTLFLASAWI